MRLDLIHGRTILITGAAGGIGSALCRALAPSNRVLALDLDAEGLRRLGPEVVPLEADVTDFEGLVRVLAPCGPVDVLVNNAGGSRLTGFQALDPAGWRRDVDVNLTGAYHCFEAVRAGMVAQGKGAIVNVGSANGLMAMGHPAYSAAKAGLISLTQSLALEFGALGIRANIVLPGTVSTSAWDDRKTRDPEVMERLRRWYPSGRLVPAEDVAHAVVFLASEYAASINGAVVCVDGGLLAGNRLLAKDLTLEDF